MSSQVAPVPGGDVVEAIVETQQRRPPRALRGFALNHTETFAYRVSRAGGVASLDVCGRVTDDTVEPVEDAIDRLAVANPGGIVVGLTHADVPPALAARLREHAYAALPPGRVVVEDGTLPAEMPA